MRSLCCPVCHVHIARGTCSQHPHATLTGAPELPQPGTLDAIKHAVSSVLPMGIAAEFETFQDPSVPVSTIRIVISEHRPPLVSGWAETRAQTRVLIETTGEESTNEKK